MHDFRIENPKLHALYVKWAMEDLSIVNEAIENISSVSRVDMSILAGNLKQGRDQIIKDNAAWQVALVRIETEQEPPQTEDDEHAPR